MLKKLASDEVQAQLAVADSKLGGIIREGKFNKIIFYCMKTNNKSQVWADFLNYIGTEADQRMNS